MLRRVVVVLVVLATETADAFVAALPRFSHRTVLLVDDTDLPQRGKGEFVIPLAESAGFKLLREGRQALLVRDLCDGRRQSAGGRCA